MRDQSELRAVNEALVRVEELLYQDFSNPLILPSLARFLRIRVTERLKQVSCEMDDTLESRYLEYIDNGYAVYKDRDEE